MAQKSGRQASQAEAPKRVSATWWIVPALIGSCILELVFAYFHIKISGTPMPRVAATVVASIAVLFATYFIFRNYNMGHNQGSFTGLIISALVALPVFAIAFVGLGYEISEMADLGAMYIIGTWIGSSEAAEKLRELEG